ncbi:MAG: UDP-3-O-(3-hydroxymyristoyl)glucosamine N-acyltransferase, partial [Desulfatirhabdiaceae bacterium]
VILAGQAGVSGHLTIGDGATVGPQAGIAQSVPPHTVVSGSPEMPHGQWLRVQRIVTRLPELKKKISELEKRLTALEG